MSSGWRECRLGDQVLINAQSIDKYYPYKEIEYLDTGSITDGKIDSWQHFKLENAPSRARRIVKDNDIVLSMVRPIQRHYGYLSTTKPNSVVSTGFVVLTAKDSIESYFLYSFLTQDDITEYLDVVAEGSTSAYPAFTPDVIEKLPILLPPLPEQRAIAGVLFSLDDKIDLLHRQNKTLEGMAEALWRKMFVEALGENNSEGKLGDVVYSANTGLDAIRRAPIVDKDTDIKCLRIQDISQLKTFERWGFAEVSEKDFEKYRLRKDDIIMARTCSPGINYFVRENLQAVFNNGLVRIRVDKSKVYPLVLYYLFKTRAFVGHIDGISGGTSVQLNMQIGDLLDYDISFPSMEYQAKYIDTFLSIDHKTLKNHKQIRTLTRLRDTLLPKLLSGEVRVK